MPDETGQAKVNRIFVEKRKGYDTRARILYRDLKENLSVKGLEAVRVAARYDILGITPEIYARSRGLIFSDPTVDLVYDEFLPLGEKDRVFVLEYRPGQFDSRADSAAQCLQILTGCERPEVTCAQVIVLTGKISDDDFTRIKKYCLNPIESREASLHKPQKLPAKTQTPPDVEVLSGFNSKTSAKLHDFSRGRGLAMGLEDLLFCQAYFRDAEKREPTITEIKVLDTYWSDHCRHTTFLTKIEEINIAQGNFTAPIKEAFREYLASRKFVYGNKEKDRDICLMDIALLAMKELRQKGLLDDLDESEEINACSIVIKADIDCKEEEWLLMFKNETHNHPTEMEPFGGAATCLGGAIRDPLSGRSYVYQAMRVTGCADPREKVEKTLPGKLPQRKITIGAAEGYSSYGNQIGVAAGPVAEFYDEGFLAKRMEVGAVIGAVPRRNVVRQKPAPGDAVILVGGRTGRDGIGGATGSSREQTTESLFTAGAEVQKGNPPEERKLQRLFRNPEAAALIKKCNDFGAGGVAVAIGELAEGLDINLDAVPQKYDGLDGTELALSESQERMAVVVAPENAQAFRRLAAEENLQATIVARVTDSKRLRMFWRDSLIVDLSRDFLDTHGVKQKTKVAVAMPDKKRNYFHSIPQAAAAKLPDLKKAWLANLQDLNVCSQKGLQERFDSTAGASTVLLPLGGKYQETPAEGLAATLPLLSGETDTTALMAFGYSPQLARWSPFHGALYAVVEAAARIVAIGGDYRKIRLTLQEYFEKLGQDPYRWGKPFAALLGAFLAQKKLGIPAIGGKDSMSGTFMDLHVPPTLIAFAVGTARAGKIISPEFKEIGSKVVLVPLPRDENERPDFTALQKNFAKITELLGNGQILAAHTVRFGGLAAALSKMSFGNRIGINLKEKIKPTRYFTPDHGSFVLEIDKETDLQQALAPVDYRLLGYTQKKEAISLGTREITLKEALAAWHSPLEKVFPAKPELFTPKSAHPHPYYHKKGVLRAAAVIEGRPKVLIPVFPGTNGEYDAAKAFTRAGGKTEITVIKNLTAKDLEQSAREIAEKINKSQILMLPGGFSTGDEPGGAGKFIATFFHNPYLAEALQNFLNKRDGLILGIGNGFQALLRLGLLPYGEIVDPVDPLDPLDSSDPAAKCGTGTLRLSHERYETAGEYSPSSTGEALHLSPKAHEEAEKYGPSGTGVFPLPYGGRVRPTLTCNAVGRHVSRLVRTKVVSALSPWFSHVQPGDIHTLALSCGEGRFVADTQTIAALFATGQVAARYVDFDGNPEGGITSNPCGSFEAIEAVSSPDGRILGKMCHSERSGIYLAQNIPGEKEQHLFTAGINYFK